jgi:hypothetical protein
MMVSVGLFYIPFSIVNLVLSRETQGFVLLRTLLSACVFISV